MTVTDELLARLAQRDVKYRNLGDLTFWLDENGVKWCAQEQPSGALHLQAITFLTPEQAIEATLGLGTCKEVQTSGSSWMCSECGCEWRHRDSDGEPFMDAGGSAETPRFCPWCGAKVVEE